MIVKIYQGYLIICSDSTVVSSCLGITHNLSLGLCLTGAIIFRVTVLKISFLLSRSQPVGS